MDFALILRELLSRRRLLAVGVAMATLAAILSVYRVDGLSLKARALQHSSATTQVLVDSPSSVLGNLQTSFEPLSARALVYSNFMTSPVVLQLIGQAAGIPGDQIYAAGPVNANVPRVEQEPSALKRNVQITGETAPYRLNFNSDANLPTIDILAQAPTTAQAIALANGAAVGLQHYVAALQDANQTPSAARVTIRQLGSANGGVVDAGISKALAMAVFVIVFFAWCVLVLVVTRFRDTWRASAAVAHEREVASGTGSPAADDPALHDEAERWHAEPADVDPWPRAKRSNGAPVGREVDVEPVADDPYEGAQVPTQGVR